MGTPDSGVAHVFPSNSNTPTDTNTNPLAYSQVAKSSSSTHIFPKKEQAILLNTVDNLKLSDYVISIGNLVGAKNILFASRISNNRISVYLSSTEHVDKIIQHHSKVKIGENEISIRRLITPAKRIIISNVCPSIPHSILEQIFSNMGFRLVSPISFLRAGIQGDEYSHILSFRRQLYVQPDDNINLPSSTIIKHEDTNYRVFFSYDELICFACKLSGHIASNCPNPPQTNTIPEESSHGTTPIAEEKEAAVELPTTFNRSCKRTAPSTVSSPTGSIVIDENDPLIQIDSQIDREKHHFLTPTNTIKQKTKNVQKKLKISESTENLISLTDMLLPVKQYIENATSPFILNYSQLYDFLENVHGSPDPLSVSLGYTNDTEALLSMLGTLYTKLLHRNIKSRFTRIRRKINRQLTKSDVSEHDSDTDTSQMSY